MMRFKKPVAAGGALILTALLWVIALTRWLLDALGWATTVADLRHSNSIFQRGLGWLFETPAYVAFLLGMAVVGAYIVWLFRSDRKSPESQNIAAKVKVTNASDTEHELKMEIARLREQVYECELKFDGMRFERDELTKNFKRVSGELEKGQIAWDSERRALYRDMEQRFSKEDRKKILGELIEAKKDSKALQSLVPVIRAYKRAVGEAYELGAFANSIEQVQAGGNIPDEVRRISEIAEAASTEFDRNHRAAMVTAVMGIKHDFGLVVPELTDDKLTQAVYGRGSVTDFGEGFKTLADALARILVERASKLDV